MDELEGRKRNGNGNGDDVVKHHWKHGDLIRTPQFSPATHLPVDTLGEYEYTFIPHRKGVH